MYMSYIVQCFRVALMYNISDLSPKVSEHHLATSLYVNWCFSRQEQLWHGSFLLHTWWL